MGKIHILSEHISNKIAAGEVVERPASVVKELVENSIDAGASSITVEIRDGGISYIRVSDNGSGMDEDDAKASFIRHATSKIIEEDDLNSIRTLGFRGEALASIAAVSNMEMLTKTADSTFGTKITVDGGEYKYIGSTGCPNGTTVIVQNLFYNTPARLKFLKKESREGAAVSDTILKLALSKPNISFKYINNNKLIFNTLGDGNIKNTILTLYGKDVYDSLIKVSYTGNVLSISGFIGSGDAARSNRNFQTFFVNNRYVKNRILSAAVDNAYKTFLPINKFGFCILYISICPELVDVNVHPTKAEVKFQDDSEVFSAIFNTVRNGLTGEKLIPDITIKDEPIYMEQQQLFKDTSDALPVVKEEKQIFHREDRDIPKSVSVKESKDYAHDDYGKLENEGKVYSNLDNVSIKNSDVLSEVDIKNLLPPLVVIGQYDSTYILAQGPDSLYIIDQHAAHERVFYEIFKSEYEMGGIQSQGLIAPIVVELTPKELSVIRENADIILKLGFEFEYFGNNSIMLRSVPFIFGSPQLKKFFLEIVDLMDEKASSGKNSIDNMLYTMACKNAVKANDRLSLKEMEELINKLRQTINPYTCPHGRPTIIKLTRGELEKRFKRVQ